MAVLAARLHAMLMPHVGPVLAGRGIAIEDLRPLENYAMTDSVLLVGSHARGEATAESDLDIAVICDEVPERPGGSRGYVSVVGDSVIAGSVNGMVLTVEYLRRDMIYAICAVLGRIPGSPESPSIANLGVLELRTLERVGAGIVLRLAERDRDIIAGVDLAKARANKAALAFRLSVGHLRAAVDPAADPSIRAIRLREAAQDLLIAEANARGVLTFDTKHLSRRLASLPAGPMAAVLRHLRQPGADAAVVTHDIRTASADFLAQARQEEARVLIGTLLAPAIGGLEALLHPLPRPVP
jgi:hypothetical protein